MIESGKLVARDIWGYGRFTKVKGSTKTWFSALEFVGATEFLLVLSGDCVVSSHSASSGSYSPSSKPTDFFLSELVWGRSVDGHFFWIPEVFRRRAGVE